VVGRTLGGWLSDNISWAGCFLINMPVGVFAMATIALVLRAPQRQLSQQQGHGFDVIGLILVATFLGAPKPRTRVGRSGGLRESRAT